MSTTNSFESAIVANGDYVFPPQTPCREVFVEVYGNFGGGTLTLKQVSPAGTLVAYTGPVAFTADGYAILRLPSSGRLAATLATATSPSVRIKVSPTVG